MRVFYPMSARIAEFVNEGAQAPAGLMMMWSAFCIGLLVLVLSALPSFEAGAGNDDYSASVRINPAEQPIHASEHQTARGALKPAAARNQNARVSTQDYINAHRCAQSHACTQPVMMRLPSAEPAKQPASAGLYL